MSQIVEASLTAEEARRLTEEVRREAARLWLRVLELYERGAHTALGYRAWGDYWEAEFQTSGGRGEQLVRAGRVARALEAAGLPLPANDRTAQELIPVLRAAPDEIATVWAAALKGADGGQPTGTLVRELVEPYRDRGDERRARRVERSARVNRERHRVSAPLERCHAFAESAVAGLEAALATQPDEDALRDWLDHAERAEAALAGVVTALRGKLGK